MVPVVSSSTRHAHQAPPRTAPRRAMRPARCVGSQDLYRLYGRAFARVLVSVGLKGLRQGYNQAAQGGVHLKGVHASASGEGGTINRVQLQWGRHLLRTLL